MENTNEVIMEPNPRVCPKTGVPYSRMEIVPADWEIQMDRAFHDYRCSTCGVDQDSGTPVPYCAKDDPGTWNCVPCERREQKLVKTEILIEGILEDAGIAPEKSLALRMKLLKVLE